MFVLQAKIGDEAWRLKQDVVVSIVLLPMEVKMGKQVQLPKFQLVSRVLQEAKFE